MEHGYKLLVILLRPLIYFLVAILVGMFGERFFKRMLSWIGVLLTVLSLGGLYVTYTFVQKVADPYYFVTQDEVQQMIVGAVMTILMALIAIGYFIMSYLAGKQGEAKHKEFFKNYVGLGFKLIPCLAFIGFSIPLCIMEETAGKIAGGLIEVVAIFVAIRISINHFKELKSEKKENTSE